jgi:hypothetical protein
MIYESFQMLHSKLKDGIIIEAKKGDLYYQPKGGRKGGRFINPPVPNGAVTTCVQLARALHYSVLGRALHMI